MILKLNIKKFLVSLAIPLLVGGLSAFIIRNDINIYDSVNTLYFNGHIILFDME